MKDLGPFPEKEALAGTSALVCQSSGRLPQQTEKVRNALPLVNAGGFSYFVKVRMITYLLKKYNQRDVEVEMAIQKRLSKYPVPDFIWDEYHLDQEINDRGIALDMDVVENAITFDERSNDCPLRNHAGYHRCREPEQRDADESLAL